MRRRFTSSMVNSEESPLFIEALEDGVSFSVHYTSGVLQYCVDDGGYSSLSSDTFSETINAGSRFYIKGDHCYLQIYYPRFTIKGKCKIGGNVHSAVFGDIYSTITSSGRCSFMFTRCDIVEVENDFLKYTTLIEGCYMGMFAGCTLLQTAPDLPATTLINSCYTNIFEGCTNLNYIKMLATDISAYRCLSYWVSGVASSGTFVKNSAMTSLPTGVSGIPSGWTVENA